MVLVIMSICCTLYVLLKQNSFFVSLWGRSEESVYRILLRNHTLIGWHFLNPSLLKPGNQRYFSKGALVLWIFFPLYYSMLVIDFISPLFDVTIRLNLLALKRMNLLLLLVHGCCEVLILNTLLNPSFIL